MTCVARTLIVLAAVVLAACGRTPEVVVHTSVRATTAAQVFERFERETGIRVRAVSVDEHASAEACAAALRGDAAHPRADVIWANDPAVVVGLAACGMLSAGAEAVTAHWPGRAADGRWAALGGCARVVVYAPERVNTPPELWTDLLDTRYRGRIAMADPRTGTTRAHFGAMKVYWDAKAMPGYFEAWAEGLVDNAPLVLTGDGASVADAVARGDADIGMTDAGDVRAAQARGARVAMVQPRHARDARHLGGGTLQVPTAVGVVEGAPHPEQAAAFMAFMLTPDTERLLLAASGSAGADAADGAVHNPLSVDPAAAAQAADGAVAVFLDMKRAHDAAPPQHSRTKGEG